MKCEVRTMLSDFFFRTLFRKKGFSAASFWLKSLKISATTRYDRRLSRENVYDVNKMTTKGRNYVKEAEAQDCIKDILFMYIFLIICFCLDTIEYISFSIVNYYRESQSICNSCFKYCGFESRV